MSNTQLVLVNMNANTFNDNELTIIRLGENPEEFDHYIFNELSQV